MGRNLETSAGTFPAENFSVMCHSILSEVPLTFWKWFEVVPPMFNLGPFLGPFDGVCRDHSNGIFVCHGPFNSLWIATKMLRVVWSGTPYV